MYVVDNSTNFERKLQRAARFIRKLVGVEEHTTMENNNNNINISNNNNNNNSNNSVMVNANASNPLCPSMGTIPLSPPSLTNSTIDLNEGLTTLNVDDSSNSNNYSSNKNINKKNKITFDEYEV